MAGQIIVLPNVRTGAPLSAPRIVMTEADRAAAALASLGHVMSARSISNVAQSGVSGRCRNTGQAFVPKGDTAKLRVQTLGGFPAICLTGVEDAALAMPPGSASASFSVVATIFISETDFAGDSAINFLSVMNSDSSYAGQLLRYYPAQSPIPNTLRTAGNGNAGFYPDITGLSSGWSVVVIDYDASAKDLFLAVNDIDSGVSAQNENQAALTPEAYIETGYHLSTSSLRSSGIGDIYAFGVSLMSTETGRAALKQVTESLVAEYQTV